MASEIFHKINDERQGAAFLCRGRDGKNDISPVERELKFAVFEISAIKVERSSQSAHRVDPEI
jgi:hypothetical protein